MLSARHLSTTTISVVPDNETSEPDIHIMTCRSSSRTRLASVGGRAFAAPQSPNALLSSTPKILREQRVYAYIVTSIKTTPPHFQLHQRGSGPNLDGVRITLCTCKQKDRATFRLSSDPSDPWKDVWVAGL